MGSIPDRGTKTQMLQGTDQKKKKKRKLGSGRSPSDQKTSNKVEERLLPA